MEDEDTTSLTTGGENDREGGREPQTWMQKLMSVDYFCGAMDRIMKNHCYKGLPHTRRFEWIHNEVNHVPLISSMFRFTHPPILTLTHSLAHF